MQSNDESIQGVVLGLDIGDVRIGVARAHSLARLPEPIEVIDRKKLDPLKRLEQIVAEYEVEAFVIGLPAYKSGQAGPQTEAVQAFAKTLQEIIPLPQIFVDESFTSLEADSHLKTEVWKNQVSNDALAACVILERYFTEVAHV